MYYVISGVNGNLKAFLTFISWIDSFDKDAVYIHLGDFISEDNGWEFMNWAQENITPTGKYQAVLSRDIQMVLDACNPSKKMKLLFIVLSRTMVCFICRQWYQKIEKN